MCVVRVVQSTWAPDVEGSIAYYSELEDSAYHTINIGLENTETGHCGKTLAIISRFHRMGSHQPSKELKWLVVADDDTLLSATRLLRLLRCYDHTHPILLGEVYGYGAQRPHGYAFVTGGGGYRVVACLCLSCLGCVAAVAAVLPVCFIVLLLLQVLLLCCKVLL